MNVAVTGASGLVGSALVPALAEVGHHPIRLVRGRRGGADAVRWDPAAGTIDAAGLEGIDAVVHLAGAGIGDKRWTDARKREILESRLQGTTLLAETLAGLSDKPAVLVSASGTDFYGSDHNQVFTEDSPSGEGFISEVCQAWEGATAAAADAGIRVVRIRSGAILSADGGLLKRLLLPFKLGLGGRVGSGNQYLSWIAIDDHVGAVLHLLTADVAGPVNLTTPNPVTNREFVETLGRVLRRPTVIPTPLLPLRLVYSAELVEVLLLSGKRVLPERLEASGYKLRHAELEDALRALLDRPA
jgi:uncharacterized protein